MHGGAFGMPNLFSKKDYYGTWEMEQKSKYGEINGCKQH
jgi:hypothetical protein